MALFLLVTVAADPLAKAMAGTQAHAKASSEMTTASLAATSSLAAAADSGCTVGCTGPQCGDFAASGLGACDGPDSTTCCPGSACYKFEPAGEGVGYICVSDKSPRRAPPGTPPLLSSARFATSSTCPTTVECCVKSIDFCKSEDTSGQAFCGPDSADKQHFGNVGCACPFGSTYDAAKKACSAVPKQTFYCTHDSSQKACGECETNADCGTGACWAVKDEKCPHELKLEAKLKPCDEADRYLLCERDAAGCCCPGGICATATMLVV